MNPHVPFRKQVIVKTVSVAYQDQFLRRRVLITLLLLTALYISVSGQTVSEIITDYNGYWKSGNAAVNAVKPDNSHKYQSPLPGFRFYSNRQGHTLMVGRFQEQYAEMLLKK